ncbi:LppU/SCO3897 family protein [Mycobacteroides abscessus]|uniref:LppU/SCO3897 family protein n=1 Tax=Mycobacteroides abscessus TaxID=36809 RepID=UPI003FF085A4
MLKIGGISLLKTVGVVVNLCIFVATGCASTADTPQPKPSAAHQESTDFADIPGQFPTPGSLTANGQAEAPVGGCVNLGGELVNASLTVVDCGSDRNTYRIVQRVNIPQECGDTDRSYYHNSEATGQYTACLDLAWAKDSCISLGQPVAKVVCTDTNAPKRIKPLKIILDTTTLEGCPSGGYKHPQRKFTVCTEVQR